MGERNAFCCFMRVFMPVMVPYGNTGEPPALCRLVCVCVVYRNLILESVGTSGTDASPCCLCWEGSYGSIIFVGSEKRGAAERRALSLPPSLTPTPAGMGRVMHAQGGCACSK